MKLLHTGDWHVGKVLKGYHRIDEQRAVLAELAALVATEAIDLVVVTGDLFDTAAPSPDAQRLAWDTLLTCRSNAAQVIVIAGNHDSPDAFDAVRPVFEAAGVTMIGRTRRPAEGGVLEFIVNDEPVVVATLPFVSQRGVVKAAELMEISGADARGKYQDRIHQIIEQLTQNFRSDAINLLISHLTVTGGQFGGGEREAHSIFDYHVAAQVFPTSASYVALGHLHRAQKVPAPCPVWYSGSPIAVDFGEGANTPGVLIVDVAPGKPAKVEHRPLKSAKTLVTLTGTLAQLSEQQPPVASLVRVVVTDLWRAGIADDVRALFPDVLEIRVARPDATTSTRAARLSSSVSPSELFDRYLAEHDIEDPRLGELFSVVLDEVTNSFESSS